MFYCELIYRSVTESETNQELYDFLMNSFILLDEESGSITDFPLQFMIDLTRFHGFFPLGSYSEFTPFFDEQSGRFCQSIPSHPDYLDKNLSNVLSYYVNYHRPELTLHFASAQRYQLLNRMIEYYRLHLPGFSNLKSPAVIHELFR